MHSKQSNSFFKLYPLMSNKIFQPIDILFHNFVNIRNMRNNFSCFVYDKTWTFLIWKILNTFASHNFNEFNLHYNIITYPYFFATLFNFSLINKQNSLLF